jgi:hypothetical protein
MDKRKLKYHYEEEVCGNCGHVKRYRVYHYPKSKRESILSQKIKHAIGVKRLLDGGVE